MSTPSINLSRARGTELFGWADVSSEVAQPPVASGGSGSAFTQWSAKRSPSASETLLLGCVATPIPGWVEEMRATVNRRTVALTSASAERLIGGPVEVHNQNDYLSLRRTDAPAGTPHAALARTFVGFTDHQVSTCFALCGSPDARPSRACDALVLGAQLEGSMRPPPPGVFLGALQWAVQHPSPALASGGALVLAASAIAVAFRRKPRSRI